MWSCYLEIFRVIHFFVWTLSWTVIWNLKALLWRQRLTRTLIFIDNWHNGDGLENSFCPPTPAGVRQETGPGPQLVDTELLLLLPAHWLPGQDNSELLLCHCKVKLQSSAASLVLPEWYGSKSIYSREMKTMRSRQWLLLVMVCALKSCCLREISLHSVGFLKGRHSQVKTVYSCTGQRFWSILLL